VKSKENQRKLPGSFQTHLIFLLLISAVAIITYLPYSTYLGFQHDDWQFVFARSAGQDIKFYFTVDRPFMGTILAKSALFLGYKALWWQIYAFLLRLAGGFVFYLLLDAVFSRMTNKTPLFLAAVFFILYPGFLLLPSAVSYSPHFLALLLALVSFYLTTITLKLETGKKKFLVLTVLLLVIAGILTYAYLAILEYFIGMIAVLIVLLIASIPEWQSKQARKRNIKLVFSRALAPLIAAGIFLYWRFWIFVPKRTAVNSEVVFNSFAKQPLDQIISVLHAWISSSFQTLITAYVTPFLSLFYNLNLGQILLHCAIAVCIAGGFLYYLYKSKASEKDGWQKKWIVTGLFMAILPLLPIVLVGREVNFSTDYNRYTLQSIPGVAVFLVGFCFLFKNPYRPILVTVLIAISIITLLNNEARFAHRWKIEKEAWQQVAIRIPGLKEGTVLAIHLPPNSGFAEGFEITAAANLIYSGGVFPTRPSMPFVIGEIVNEITLPRFLEQSIVDRYTKTVPLTLDYSKSLILSQPTENSCLHLIGNSAYLSEYEPAEIRTVAPFSHPNQVVLDGDSPALPEQLFGKIRADNWCTIYQQADLAAQQGDWKKVASLANEAQARGFSPKDPSEWLPFYQAFLNLDDENLSVTIREKLVLSKGFLQNLCNSPTVDPDLRMKLCQ
jgi:hypothetical protein